MLSEELGLQKLLKGREGRPCSGSVCLRIEGIDAVDKLMVENTKTNTEEIIKTDGIFVEIGLISASNFVLDSIKNKCRNVTAVSAS